MNKRKLFSVILVATLFLSFTLKKDIAQCYLSFKTSGGLAAANPDRLPDDSEQIRAVNTTAGDVNVTRVDGYRILYNNVKGAPFVNLKVELSKEGAHSDDQKNLIENLKYLNSGSKMETKELIEMELNGYKIYGLSRGSIESGSTLGIFMMFPGNGVTVYFYFNNMKPEYRNFESLEDYKKQRDQFMTDYTKHLAGCKDK